MGRLRDALKRPVELLLEEERDRAITQHDSLYLAVKEEVEHLQEVREKAPTGDDFETGVADVHRRLQAILDKAGEKREVPDYGRLRSTLDALVTAAAPVESGEGGEPEREAFSEAFQDACFLLAELDLQKESK